MTDEHEGFEDYLVDRRAPTYIQQRSAMEKHIQTILAVVITALIGWIGMSVTDSRETIARLEVQTTGMQLRMSEIRSDIKMFQQTGVTRDGVDQRFAVCQERMSDLEHRMLEVEKQAHFEKGFTP